MKDYSIEYTSNNNDNNNLDMNIKIQKHNKEIKAKMKKRFMRGFYISTGWLCLVLVTSIYFQQLDNIPQLYALSHTNYIKNWSDSLFGSLIKSIILIQNFLIIFSIKSQRDKSIFKLLFKLLHYPFCFLQITSSVNFTLSIYYAFHSLFVWLNLSLNGVSLILIYICYIRIKRQKNITSMMLITLYTYISIVSSFVCYRSMYIGLYLFAYESKLFAFIVDGMQLAFGIMLLAYYKDVFFILTSLMLQSYNLLIQYSIGNTTAVYHLITLNAFSFLTIAITTLKYTNSVIGRTEGDDSIRYLLEYKESKQ